MNLALAILALGFLIIVHEAGHYFVARWCGMRVERFSIGFGPGILKRQSRKTGTIFQIAPIPFGGFVEIRGMNIAEDVDPDDTHAYPNRPTWQRFVTIFAGPATNYLSAVVLAFFLYTCHGMDTATEQIHVAGIITDYDPFALKYKYDAVGKLEVGDQILAVDGVPLRARKDEPGLSARVNEKQGKPVTLTISRDGKQLTVDVTPRLATDGAGKPTYLMGIMPSNIEARDVSVATAGWSAITLPVKYTQSIAAGLYKIIIGEEKAQAMGPAGIVDEFQKAFDRGLDRGINLLILLSVYLGLFNLLPLPALDGGRLVFLGYELVTRRRANPKIEAMVHMFGIMLLGILMILVTLSDCKVI